MNLRSGQEWVEFCQSENRPLGLPTNVYKAYKGKGWKGMNDWLGITRSKILKHRYRSFLDARSFVRKLSFDSRKEWYEYCKSVSKPNDIPRGVEKIYIKYWKGWADFLGKEK